MAGIGQSSLEQADNDNDNDNDDDDGDDYDYDMFIMMNMSMVMIMMMKYKMGMPRESLDSLFLTDPPAFPGAALQTPSSLNNSFI